MNADIVTLIGETLHTLARPCPMGTGTCLTTPKEYVQ